MQFAGFSWRDACAADLPTYYTLRKHWQELPPAQVQLARMAAYLGIEPAKAGTAARSSSAAPASPASDTEKEEAIARLQGAGLPIFEGPLPDDARIALMGLPLT